jgi:hypothetical protein
MRTRAHAGGVGNGAYPVGDYSRGAGGAPALHRFRSEAPRSIRLCALPPDFTIPALLLARLRGVLALIVAFVFDVIGVWGLGGRGVKRG